MTVEEPATVANALVHASRAMIDSVRAGGGGAELTTLAEYLDASTSRSVLLFASKGSIERIDVWVAPTGAVLVPYTVDPERVVACEVVGAAGRWPALCAVVANTSGSQAESGPDELQGASTDDLLSDVVAGTSPGRASVLVRSQSNGVALPDVVRVTGDRVWWGAASRTEEVTLTSGREASYWAAIRRSLVGP